MYRVYQKELAPAPLADGPTLSLPRPAERSGHPLWHRGRAHRFPMVGHRAGVPEARVAGWRAPPEMVGRQPYLPRFMAGGPDNPLGARALYLGHSVFRIHGTTSRRRSGTPFRQYQLEARIDPRCAHIKTTSRRTSQAYARDHLSRCR
jgi:hypothetical protein